MKDPTRWDVFKTDRLYDWQIRLIEDVCASDAFGSMEQAGPILRYLAVHSRPEDKKARAGKSLSDVFKIGSNPALVLSRIQKRLEKYFDGEEGGRKEHRININFRASLQQRNAMQYALRYEPNRGQSHHTRPFWSDYLVNKLTPTRVVYGIPLFESNARYEVFTRKAVKNELHQLEDSERGCYPFLTRGEILAASHLRTWLTDKGIRVDDHGFRREQGIGDFFAKYPNPDDANVIVVGTPRDNGILQGYQMTQARPGFRFILTDLHIEDKEESDTKKNASSRNLAHVLVSRRPGTRGGTVTMIASNTGQAVERLATLLTSEPEMEKLSKEEPFQSWRDGEDLKFPHIFQLLFTVGIQDYGRFADEARLVKWWPEQTASAGNVG